MAQIYNVPSNLANLISEETMGIGAHNVSQNNGKTIVFTKLSTKDAKKEKATRFL